MNYFGSSRLRGRRSKRWRPVWRASSPGRAKWSTWFAPWSRRGQRTSGPLNACARAFPLTPWQMWRWPRSKQDPTGKPKPQPKSPDGNRGEWGAGAGCSRQTHWQTLSLTNEVEGCWAPLRLRVAVKEPFARLWSLQIKQTVWETSMWCLSAAIVVGGQFQLY